MDNADHRSSVALNRYVFSSFLSFIRLGNLLNSNGSPHMMSWTSTGFMDPASFSQSGNFVPTYV